MVHRLFFIFLVIVLQANIVAAAGELHSDRAMEIQAAFLVKFSSYVKWPESAFSNPDEPLIIGIFGRDPFGSTIDNIARSFKVNGREVEVRRFNNPADLRRVHILFVPSSEMDRMGEITAALSGRSVLLVGHSPGFLEQSGMINFVIVGKKIRFNICRKNYQKAGLVISSKLLSVAHEIK